MEMGKPLSFSKTVNELCNQYPELVEIMKEIGFENIVNPRMLVTVGRIMTIPKGAAMRGLDLAEIKVEFEKRGFTVVD